jgi:hypothetical protein
MAPDPQQRDTDVLAHSFAGVATAWTEAPVSRVTRGSAKSSGSPLAMVNFESIGHSPQTPDPQRRIGGKLGGRHAHARPPAADAAPGEKILRQVARSPPPCRQADIQAIRNERGNDQKIDHF